MFALHAAGRGGPDGAAVAVVSGEIAIVPHIGQGDAMEESALVAVREDAVVVVAIVLGDGRIRILLVEIARLHKQPGLVGQNRIVGPLIRVLEVAA